MTNQNVTEDASRYANKIRTSLLAVARTLGVTPKQLAEAIYDKDANDDFRLDLSLEMIKAKTAQLKAERAESKEDSKNSKKK